MILIFMYIVFTGKCGRLTVVGLDKQIHKRVIIIHKLI